MRTERVAVILVEILNPPTGAQVFRLFEVHIKIEASHDRPDGAVGDQTAMEILTDDDEPARADGALIHFRACGSNHEQTGRARVFLAVRAAIHRRLQEMLGGTHGFYG